jgi:hypothetical protein
MGHNLVFEIKIVIWACFLLETDTANQWALFPDPFLTVN